MFDFKFKKRVLFIGVPDMAFVGMEMLLKAGANIVGVVGPKKNHNTYQNFRDYVYSKRLNFIEYDRLDEPQLLNTLRELNIDIALTFSFNEKIPKVFMDTIKDGILNMHPSMLPNYRGGNPYSRVILNNERETGVTVHFMSEEFDTGDIVAQEIYKLKPDETMGTLFNITNNIGCKMQLKALIEYEKKGVLPRRKQPLGDFIKAPNIKENERFINYNNSADDIERKVRALNPFIVALTLFRDQVIYLHKVKVEHTDMPDNFANGEICKIENDKVYIKTSKGCIIPQVLQYGGYFIGDCADFIKIVNPQTGEKFING